MMIQPVLRFADSASTIIGNGLKTGCGTGGNVCPGANTLTSVTAPHVVSILLYLIGGISIIMIIVGGLRYTISNGNPSAVNDAKNTILYAVVGLAVAVGAYAIVTFVTVRFGL